ncbi:MAG: hypothetical protein ACK4MX_01180 [Thermaurantiacus sp.]
MSEGSGSSVAEMAIMLEGVRADERTLELLMDELGSVSGTRVERATEGVAPDGSKALSLEALGLLARIGRRVFPEVVKLLGDWLGRQPPGTKLRLKIGDTELEWEGGGKPPKELLDLAGRLAGG